MFELRDSKPSMADRIAARAAAWPASRSPFGVLCRAFFAQFFTSEIGHLGHATPSSDDWRPRLPSDAGSDDDDGWLRQASRWLSSGPGNFTRPGCSSRCLRRWHDAHHVLDGDRQFYCRHRMGCVRIRSAGCDGARTAAHPGFDDHRRQARGAGRVARRLICARERDADRLVRVGRRPSRSGRLDSFDISSRM